VLLLLLVTQLGLDVSLLLRRRLQLRSHRRWLVHLICWLKRLLLHLDRWRLRLKFLVGLARSWRATEMVNAAKLKRRWSARQFLLFERPDLIRLWSLLFLMPIWWGLQLCSIVGGNLRLLVLRLLRRHCLMLSVRRHLKPKSL
jgi:hypothetical protein